MTIMGNAGNKPLYDQPAGSVPDVSGALLDRLQPIVFSKVTKRNSAFQVIETGDPIHFEGHWQPFHPRDLLLKPEGQRLWKFYWLHALIALPLKPDDVILYRKIQYRIMGVNDNGLYGYYEYECVEDYEGGNLS